MDLEQSHHYYQPWNDNKINDKSYLSYEQRTFGFQARHWTY